MNVESEFKLKCCFSSLEALPGRKLKGQLTFFSSFSGWVGVELRGPSSSPVLGKAWVGVEAAGVPSLGPRQDAMQRGGQVGSREGMSRCGPAVTEPRSGTVMPHVGVMAQKVWVREGRCEVGTSELGWRGTGIPDKGKVPGGEGRSAGAPPPPPPGLLYPQLSPALWAPTLWFSLRGKARPCSASALQGGRLESPLDPRARQDPPAGETHTLQTPESCFLSCF